MGVSNTSYQPQVGVGAKSSKITNLPVPVINTEVPHVLQNGLRSIIVKSRVSNTTLQCAFTATESASKYVTIKKNNVLAIDLLQMDGATLYVQSDKVTTVEILELYT